MQPQQRLCLSWHCTPEVQNFTRDLELKPYANFSFVLTSFKTCRTQDDYNKLLISGTSEHHASLSLKAHAASNEPITTTASARDLTETDRPIGQRVRTVCRVPLQLSDRCHYVTRDKF